MPRRPPHKRKRDAFENDGNRTRLSRKGQVNLCTLCGKSGHNQRACPSKNEKGSTIDVVTLSTSTRGGTSSARGGSASARGGNTSIRGGSSFARGGKTSARGGKTSARGWLNLCKGWGRGDGSNEARPTTNEAVRTWLRTINGKVVRTKGRGDGSRSRMYPNGIRPIGYGVSWDPVDGETMLGDSMGIPRPAWPEGITPEDDEEPVQELQDEEPVHVERRVSKRLKLKCFKKKSESGPGLTKDDAISIE
ncbi:tetratricopeptide-like helical domain, DYW domain protein [Tanacetum coccineum]